MPKQYKDEYIVNTLGTMDNHEETFSTLPKARKEYERAIETIKNYHGQLGFRRTWSDGVVEWSTLHQV